jgi:hypothetical protein
MKVQSVRPELKATMALRELKAILVLLDYEDLLVNL